jgi:hypothetical protein
MENHNISEYMKDRYFDQINWYDGKAQENQKKYRRLQWTLIILAAMTPALIELDLNELIGNGFGHLATVTSVIVAILTAAMKTFKYQENWINYRTTCEALRREKFFYDGGIGEYQNTLNKEALFIERAEGMMSRENTLWISAQKSDSKSEEEPQD